MATSPATDINTAAAMPLDGIVLAEELLDLAERAQAYTNAAGVAIALRRGNDLLVRTTTGVAPEVGTTIPASDGLIAECLTSRKPQCCRDLDSDSRVGPAFRAMKVRSLIVIPIPGQPQPRGILAVIAPLPNAFQPTHTAILMTLSDIISSKLAARETPLDVEFDVLGDVAPPAPTPEPVLVVPDIEMAAPASPQASPALIVVAEKQTPDAEPATEAPADLSAADSAPTSPATKPLVPPALLQPAPLPLVEDKKVEADPALLSPTEDPFHFTAKKPSPISVAPARASEVKVDSKTTPPVAAVPSRPDIVPAKIATTQAATPVRPKVSSKPTPPVAAILSRPDTMLAKVATAQAVSPAAAQFAPASERPLGSLFETEPLVSGTLRFVLPGIAAAALLIVAVFLWPNKSKPTGVPAFATPPAAATAIAQATSPEPQPVMNSVPAASSQPVAKHVVEQREQAKPSKVADAPLDNPPRAVMEIAPAQPKTKPEASADVSAPKLVLGSTEPAMPILSKPNVALPAPPKSELVPATLVSRTAPVYPQLARQLGVSGIVAMNVIISRDGTIKTVKVLNGAMQLRAAAVEAVRQWRYKPATLNGTPVETSADVQVNFTR